ncbi:MULTISPECIES: diacylglycerol kinase [unclassified Colwellia]|uniref:diacylglycerol kinase n=1 Tax=unclassified Colwellia TaxID=196834 RepID=UPI0015F6F932|nr:MULTISPECIES: diacylglycerol kinase [unclassified Colwellia]MBA6357450.1 diacylglycerol kinase [Colwellia sp. BRX8-3]MBA6369155.1 diacylglycerol kinase [Colwellia sp. BRX8-5]MBA6374898.1 diacylglycerol kinase [Colwellia sp. BRX8-2]
MSKKDNKEHANANGSGIIRIMRAFSCSIKGFQAAFINEAAFRQELILCGILFPFSFIISETLTNWVILICSLLFLLLIEIINSAIEALADKISFDHHELLGRAKDLGSAAVFIALTITLLIWVNYIYLYFSVKHF